MTARATFRRMVEAVAGYEPRIATLDQHAVQACAVVDGDRRVLSGDQLVEQVTELLTPVYYQDTPQLAQDEVMRGFIADDARFVARRLDELGLQLVRKAAR